MKRPSGLGASKKRATSSSNNQSASEGGSKNAKRAKVDVAGGSSSKTQAKEGERATTTAALPDESLVMEATGESAVQDLAALYEKFETAASAEEAANWLRGVMHEADRLLRSTQQQQQQEQQPNDDEESASEDPAELEDDDVPTVQGYYGSALLRLGLLGPEMRKEGEPETLDDWVEAALVQLEPAQDASAQFGWDHALALWCSVGREAGQRKEQEMDEVIRQAAQRSTHLLRQSHQSQESDTAEEATTTTRLFLGFAGLLLPEAERLLPLPALQALIDVLREARQRDSGNLDIQAVEAEGQLVLGSKAVEAVEEEEVPEGKGEGDLDQLKTQGREALLQGEPLVLCPAG